MPSRPPSPCRHPGCAALTLDGLCPEHRGEAEVAHGRHPLRDTLYGRRWKAASHQQLRLHPLCAECERLGWAVAATVVDHIVPHRMDAKKFWDRSNWQSLCKLHHDQKTSRGG